MPEFKLTNLSSSADCEILMAIDYDDDGEVENQEFYTGSDWTDNPAELRENTTFICDEEEQEEWNYFFNGFMHLLETGELIEELKNLKEINDSYEFDDEDIKVELTEED
ncbi:hypothetical protein BGI41_03170 [Methanobrevibacter sp. 87.7]|uniref:hypothetical protein n=1 Tax=Methanobrevibacter sp. 87.7 TaxID=387957 RepID=UPI000B51356A|nr:hypothetical protein [Methanobrevibacter sp. 87.7]OWT33278.1 hypothetical protein BGI41_03170 [Methanobrevibacter sp. 87.7]